MLWVLLTRVLLQVMSPYNLLYICPIVWFNNLLGMFILHPAFLPLSNHFFLWNATSYPLECSHLGRGGARMPFVFLPEMLECWGSAELCTALLVGCECVWWDWGGSWLGRVVLESDARLSPQREKAASYLLNPDNLFHLAVAWWETLSWEHISWQS